MMEQPPEFQPAAPAPSADVVRFDGAERFVHWAHAATFFVLVATGALLWFSPAARAVAIGPYRLLPLLHEVTGALFLLLPFGPALVRRGRRLGEDVRWVLRWTPRDLVWLALKLPSMLRLPVRLPSQGKFNAGQKINAILTVFFLAVLGVTGIVIWLGRSVPYYIQEPMYDVHVLAAILVLPLVAGHLAFALTTPPALRSIVTGRVSRDWALRHHEDWARPLDD